MFSSSVGGLLPELWDLKNSVTFSRVPKEKNTNLDVMWAAGVAVVGFLSTRRRCFLRHAVSADLEHPFRFYLITICYS